MITEDIIAQFKYLLFIFSKKPLTTNRHMNTLTIFLYILGAVISWLIFYFVVKAAVRNGIREARADKEAKTFIGNNTPEKPANSAQIKLQQQYDKGEITFEEFKSQWNKIST
jgi:uncharacterized membrane protein